MNTSFLYIFVVNRTDVPSTFIHTAYDDDGYGNTTQQGQDYYGYFAPNSSTNIPGVPLVHRCEDVTYTRDGRIYVPDLHRSVKFYPTMDSNTLYIGISGGNSIKTDEYKMFEYDCYKSMSDMREVIKGQGNIPDENIVSVSPDNLKFQDINISKPTTADIINTFEMIKSMHTLKPFSGLFLHIVGHEPCYDGFYLRKTYYSKCIIDLYYLKSVIEYFKYCKFIVIFKDMCNAEEYDLLPADFNDRPESTYSFYVQYSSSRKNGKSYDSRSNSRLFSNSIVTGFKAQYCPISTFKNISSSNCYLCNRYRNLIIHNRISYNSLHESWVKPHMIALRHNGVKECDLPILQLRYVMDNTNGLESMI